MALSVNYCDVDSEMIICTLRILKGTTPAGTLHYIYVVFMFGGYVEITFGFMLECLVFLT